MEREALAARRRYRNPGGRGSGVQFQIARPQLRIRRQQSGGQKMRVNVANTAAIEAVAADDFKYLVIIGNQCPRQVSEQAQNEDALAQVSKRDLARDEGMDRYLPALEPYLLASLRFRWSIQIEVSARITGARRAAAAELSNRVRCRPAAPAAARSRARRGPAALHGRYGTSPASL